MRRLLAGRGNGTACPVPAGNPRLPISHVRVGRVLTVDSFYGCAPCADGEHGSDEDGRCLCCGWDVSMKAGTFIPVGSAS